jgi:hypothetical protein
MAKMIVIYKTDRPGDWTPYLVGTLHFENMDALKKAFASPEGLACAADMKIYAPNENDFQWKTCNPGRNQRSAATVTVF